MNVFADKLMVGINQGNGMARLVFASVDPFQQCLDVQAVVNMTQADLREMVATLVKELEDLETTRRQKQ